MKIDFEINSSQDLQNRVMAIVVRCLRNSTLSSHCSLTTAVDRVTRWANEYMYATARIPNSGSVQSSAGGMGGSSSLSMDLFNAYCGALETSLQTAGYSRGKH